MLYVLPKTILFCVELAYGHLLANGVDAVLQVPADFLYLVPQSRKLPLARRGLVRGY